MKSVLGDYYFILTQLLLSVSGGENGHSVLEQILVSKINEEYWFNPIKAISLWVVP